MNEAARSRRDDSRREPVLGSGRDASDPLAELARLVGQEDPYRNVFRPIAAPAAPATDEHDWHEDTAERRRSDDRAHPFPDQRVAGGPMGEEPNDAWHHVENAHPGPHPEDADAWADQPDERPYDDADDDRYYAAEAASHRDDAGIAEANTAVDGAEAAIPDLWARGGAGDHAAASGIDPGYDPGLARARGGGARRPLLVLGAVLLLTGGGLAASFMAKGGGAASVAATTGKGAPTILAATGPTKIKQDDPSATAPEDKDAALLNKGAGAVGGSVKVIQSEEQPADLGQLPKAADGGPVAQTQSPGPFPEAKKVKTFVVHPDGTPIYDDGQAQTDVAPPPSVAPPAPLPSTPKAAGKGTATPSSATIASLVADAPPPTDATLAPTPTPSAPKPAKIKPVAPAGSGGFGLQLAASPSEADAHAAFAKLKKKYPSELGSLSASVHQSDTGGKPVYRVRVGGMTREDASSLCSKLMAGGGSCFVVHD